MVKEEGKKPDFFASFMTTYSNLPLRIREQIVVTIDGEPITWQIAYQEVKNKTIKGEIILKKLSNLEII